MLIQYLSAHSILEFDECKLLTELGYEVYANGCYRDPKGAHTLPRPGIEGMKFDRKFFDLTAQYPKTALPKELIDPYDVLIFMHSPEAIVANWENIKHKRVIWRTIGQSTSGIEDMLRKCRAEGLQIIRYSPKERNISGYIGEDALIYFYKDPKEYYGWTGEIKLPLNFTQTLKGRGKFVHCDEILFVVTALGGKIYGNGNEDLGKYNGGEATYENQKKLYQQHRVYIYGGTWPASYTLSFMEAMMTGTPTVAIGKPLAENVGGGFDFYEIPNMVRSGSNGFVCNSVPEMVECAQYLIDNDSQAESISKAARATAIEYFGKDKIAQQWASFLGK